MKPEELYNLENPREALRSILESKLPIMFGEEYIGSDKERDIALGKVKTIIDEPQTKCLILLRGITKSTIKGRLISRLNSNDSLYDGLFLVGDKAKNFLEKSEDIPHPIKAISSTDIEATSWIFDAYSELEAGPIDLSFFKNVKNKKKFSKQIEGNPDLIDYYLFGLHTYNSDTLVNFISTTLSPETAFNNEVIDKLIIYLWLPQNYTFYMSSEKLRELDQFIVEKGLPILNSSFHPDEAEFSFKGFILPHIIIGIHDLEENKMILNPALIKEKLNWVDDGLDVDQTDFLEFISQTKYQRFLILTDRLEEKNVS